MPSSRPRQFLFASSNKGKLADVRRFFEGTGIEILSPDDVHSLLDLSPPPEVEESGNTYEENAALKVRALHAWSGMATFADDSGLEVQALGGAPGLFSARFAGEGCTYQDNINKMIDSMAGQEDRSACFVCVVAFIEDGGNITYHRGELQGSILEASRGEGGFGYDPIFLVDGGVETLAQLKEDSDVSFETHRTKALSQFVSASKVSE